MKFIVSSSELQKHLSIINPVIPSKSVLPITQGRALFEVIDGRLNLAANDLSMAIQTSLPVEVEETGRFNISIPVKTISETLKLLPEQPITIENADNSLEIKIRTDNGVYSLVCLDGADFPRPKMDEDSKSLSVAVDALTQAIERTSFAAANDEIKQAMSGVYFSFDSDQSSFVATDAHRLVHYQRKDVSSPEKYNFIVPVKSLKVVLSALSNAIDPFINLQFTDRNAFFHLGNTLFSTRLVDGRYPDYKSVIPSSSPNRVILNKKELLDALKRLDNYSSKATHLGRFQFKGNLLTIFSEDIEVASHGHENLSCLFDGEEIEIGFNINLMLDVIANVRTDEVVIELGTANRAAVVLPSEQEPNENNLMLLMPVIIGGIY